MCGQSGFTKQLKQMLKTENSDKLGQFLGRS